MDTNGKGDFVSFISTTLVESHRFNTDHTICVPPTTNAQDKIGSVNFDRPLDVAAIHHYKYLSPKEFYWKSCVRKTVDDKFKDCKNGNANAYAGRIYDDSAWQALKRNVPKYAMYDEFDDFM